jgi:5'-nucleotidase (lipoprotein e(P4) family)
MLRLLRAVAAATSLLLPSLALASGSGPSAQPSAFDCQARISADTPAPAPAAGETDSWQCTSPSHKRLTTGEHWFRDSLEYCRIATSTYQSAVNAARRAAAAHGRGHWVVFMDADETVLDNSLYERERERCGENFSNASWLKWLSAGIAAEIPGAAAFTQTVHRLGGSVAIVTNRDSSLDAATQANLKHLGIWFDYEIGHTAGQPDDKTSRWKGALAALRARTHRKIVPVMWVGDQVTDFGILDSRGVIVRAMSERDAGAAIGERYFLIANPIYGGWTGNPEN